MTEINKSIQQICEILLITKQQVVEAVEESEFLCDSNYTKGVAAFDMRRQRLIEHLNQGQSITGFTLKNGGYDLTFSSIYNGNAVLYRFFGQESGKPGNPSARSWLQEVTGNGMGDLFTSIAPAYYGVFFDRVINKELYIVYELRDGYNVLLDEYIHGADVIVTPEELAISAVPKVQQSKATFTDKKKKKKIE